MIPIAWSTMIEALVRVEGGAPDEAGILSFGSDLGHGGIFVENQRVCWAAAPGMQSRLTDLLRMMTRDHVDFDELYRRCRHEGRLLGQTLVEEGHIAPEQLERALRQHSAESLVAMCRDDHQLTRWISRGGRGYAAQFTFKPVDVLLDAVALFAPDLRAIAMAELDDLGGGKHRGGAYDFDLADSVAIPLAACGDINLHDLKTLGTWALALPHTAHELASSPSFVIASTATGETVVSWWRSNVLFALVCDDRADVARLTARHLSGERSA